ncbi:DNA-(apurinic or apyrimidinic site) endonuclease 2-like isoform X2 [Glandiceps talaboti]
MHNAGGVLRYHLYSGVATFCSDNAIPIAAEEGLTGLLVTTSGNDTVGCYGDQSDFSDEEQHALDYEGRCVITQHKIKSNVRDDEQLIAVVNVYCPRADPDDEDRLSYKLRFYSLLQARCEALLQAGRHVILLGDVNQAHKPIDHCNPDDDVEYFSAKPGRRWLAQFLCAQSEDGKPIRRLSDSHDTSGSASISPAKSPLKRQSGGQFIDTFRYFRPQQKEAFTCWSTVTAARQLNYGTRIDYIITDICLCEEEFEDCDIMPEVEGSDHCPVKATLKCTCLPAKKCPSLCTKYLPEFVGKQQKLSAFFKKSSNKSAESNSSGSNLPTAQIQPKINLGNVNQSLHVEKQGNTSTSKQPLKRAATGKQGNSAKKMKSGEPSMKKTANIMSFFQKKSGNGKVQEKSQVHEKSVDKSVGMEEITLRCVQKGGSSSNSASPVERNNETKDSAHDKNEITPSTSESTSSSQQHNEIKKSQAAVWRNMLSGPRPPPLCKGHKEPCVLRTVKKSGPNQGKQFYVCTKPEGPKSNPEARCDHFQWVGKK